jgi:hypothetical protein
VDTWINLTALWQIVVVGLLAGAGLPAVFALGVRTLSPPPTTSDGPLALATAQEPSPSPSRARVAVSALCFALVVAAIAYGLYLIVSST